MAQIIGRSMRFVVHVPRSTGERLIKQARRAGMIEVSFISAALVVGGYSLSSALRGVSQRRLKYLFGSGKVLSAYSARGVRGRKTTRGKSTKARALKVSRNVSVK